MVDPSLPGSGVILQGVHDLERGVESLPAFVVSIAGSALEDVGVRLPARRIPSPEHRLYERLAEEHGDGAHSKYNAWVRQLASFLRAARCAR